MQTWTEESDNLRQTALELLLITAGVALMYAARRFDIHEMNDLLAGFLTGALIFVVGIIAFFENIHQTITVDSTSRTITIDTGTRFSRGVRTIPFSDITNVRVAFLGRRANIIGQTYYLSLTLKNGGSFPLFFPAYFKGRGSERVENERLERLMVYLGSS